MAAAAQAAAAATAGSQQVELNNITSFISRHLPQQHLFAASTQGLDGEYSIRSAPAAGLLVCPGALGTMDSADATDADRTESTFSAAISAGGGSTATPRRRKTSDASSIQKLQALADVSEERLAKQEKRMMKNRESAARSRLRRQQHTEALEEQNAGLKAEVLALRTQMAVLHARVSELEWQLQVAEAAVGGAAAAAVSGPAAPTPPPAAAALAAAVSGAAGALSNLNVQAGQPLGNTSLPAHLGGVQPAAATGVPVAAAPGAGPTGLPPILLSQAGTSGNGDFPTAAADGGVGGGCSSTFIDALAHALAKARKSSTISERTPASPDETAAAAAEEEAVSAKGAVAALVGMASSYHDAAGEANRCTSRMEQLEAFSNQQLTSGSFGPPQQQQQQQQQAGTLPVNDSLTAVQHPQQVQQQGQHQQPAAPDLSQLLVAAMAGLAPIRTPSGKLQPSSQTQAAGARGAADLGVLGAMLAALQQAGTPSAAVNRSVSNNTQRVGSASAPQHGAQTGVAAHLRAMQAAGKSSEAATSGGSAPVEHADIMVPPVAAMAVPSGGPEGERPSKRLCP